MASVPFKVGGIGIGGYWWNNLHEDMERSGRFLPWSGAGIIDYNKRNDLGQYGIPSERYFSIGENDSIPAAFFEGLDAVHIGSPNKFHSRQTLESLRSGKLTITEKTLATNKSDFEETVSAIRREGYSNNLVLRLHYMDKVLTRILLDEEPKILKQATDRFGKIKVEIDTFFETKDQDHQRSWLFEKENGGIETDWNHTQLMIALTGAEFVDIDGAALYVVQPELSTRLPTGALIKYKIRGPLHTADARAIVRIEKGYHEGINYKSRRFLFEKDSGFLDINYVSTGEETRSVNRGKWKLGQFIDGKELSLDKDRPKGPTANEIMLGNAVRMLEDGKGPAHDLEFFERGFKGLWLLHEFTDGFSLVRDAASVRKFIEDGLDKVEC